MIKLTVQKRLEPGGFTYTLPVLMT